MHFVQAHVTASRASGSVTRHTIVSCSFTLIKIAGNHCQNLRSNRMASEDRWLLWRRTPASGVVAHVNYPRPAEPSTPS
jgi:hypothetical protein